MPRGRCVAHALGLNACRCLQDHSKAQRPWVDNEQYSRRLPKSPETKDEAEVRQARMEAARAASNRSQSSGDQTLSLEVSKSALVRNS